VKAIRYQVHLLDPAIKQLEKQMVLQLLRRYQQINQQLYQEVCQPTEPAKILNTSGRILEMSEAAKATCPVQDDH
jgi:hypothetical protein